MSRVHVNSLVHLREPRLKRGADGVPPSVMLDGFNVGAVLRVVIATVACTGVWTLLQAPERGLLQVAELSAWLVPTAFSSLLLSGGIRRWVRPIPVPIQWALGILIPVSQALLWKPMQGHSIAPVNVYGVAALAALSGFAAVYWQDLRNRALPSAVAQARLTALQARMRPHFLFNALNAVLGVLRTDPGLAERSLEDLADLVRAMMREPQRLVSFREESQLARQYLAIETLRLGARLQLRWDDDAACQDLLIPPLVIQPIIENAVLHGIEPAIEGGVIKVSTRVQGERLIVEVQNPKPPAGSPRTTPGQGIALANLRERLSLLYDLEASLSLQVGDEKVIAKLTIPVQRERRLERSVRWG